MLMDTCAPPPDDYHLHTPLCGHATGEPADYRKTAARLGIDEICFCDHAPAPCGYDPKNRMLLDQFEDYTALVQALQSDCGTPRVLFGIEADYYRGCRDFLEHWLADQPFDLVLGSIHFIGDWGFDNPDNLASWKDKFLPQVWSDYFDLLGQMAASRLFDVATHPDLPKKFGHRMEESLLRELAAPALDRVATAGMAIELNTGGLRKPVGEIYPAMAFLRLARERDIPIVFGSDAHAPAEVGAGFDAAVALALEAGYTERARYRQRRRTMQPLQSLSSDPPERL